MDYTENYFKNISKKVNEEYLLAQEARKMGLDPSREVEIPLAMSLAEKTVGLISTIYPQLKDTKIAKRILELEDEFGQLNFRVCLRIAEEVAKEKYCKFESLLQAIDAGARIGFAYDTLGVVASPIEGYTGVTLGKTKEGKDYFITNFSGPIRSAGTTATCRFLILLDYLRELFGYEKYDPTEDEIKRYITENFDYHERVNNLQYLPTEEEIIFLAKNLPIQIGGDPTEKKEVSNFKDLSRVPTNFIRGGMCLCFSEGLAQKAQKAVRSLKEAKSSGFISTGWDYLDEYIILHKKREKGSKDTTATYIKDLVAGRPVYGHPSRSGSFRFRYGRSRAAGFSATSIHPATMFLSNKFLSNGTQLKIEKPTKGCVVTCCDSIDGPIVKFKNGSVKKINDIEESKKIFNDVEEIIYLGDMLFPLGDVLNRNTDLLKPGYVEEWWGLELNKILAEKKEKKEKKENNCFDITFSKAVEYSKVYDLPFHPTYIFYWTQINSEQFIGFLKWFSHAIWNDKLVLPYSKDQREEFFLGKRALELLGVGHEVFLDNVVINEGEALLYNLGLDKTQSLKEEFNKLLLDFREEKILEFINKYSKAKIKDKAGDFIGARMGRPEKAKLRKLTGSPNALFSIGEQGGRFRSLNEAVEKGFSKAEFPLYFCEKCNKETIYRKCEFCGEETKKRFFCRECNKILDRRCIEHKNCSESTNRRVELKGLFDKAIKTLNYAPFEVPALIKGIRGTSSDSHEVEQIVKGILRAKYNLCVNKDGTIRYDGTEIPLTHFKPNEIGVSIEKLKELGYEKDCFGKNLIDENQILNLMPHDILLPSCPETPNERADDVFLNISRFIDELLEKFYNLPKHFNLDKREDLVGHLVVCMAPHNCAGVIGRILGFTKMQGLVASPFMHAAMRRDCDGDEAAVMLLMDVLLNFSLKYLPSHRGGTQDAPLVLNARIREGEVDDQILDFETCWDYPLNLYELAEQRKHSSEIKIETVKSLLKQGRNSFQEMGFTHNTTSIHSGVYNSSYKVLPSMREKVLGQMELANKLRSVDAADVARLVIERHFIRDIRGNLRKFSHQVFRCVKCNDKYRRPPLSGVCKCGGKIIFTISEGSIKKYLEPAIELAENYNIPAYTKQSLDLAKLYIESIFGKEIERQVDLKSWF
jgi:DNA polymerase II large subunit